MSHFNTLVRRSALLLPLLVLVSAGCDIAMADLRQRETAEWRKTYDLQPGGRLSVTNVNGKIDAQPAAGTQVEIVAQKSARGASVEAARQALGRIHIQETASPSEVRVETKMERSGLFGSTSLEVHYTVRVPANAEVKLSTVNGGIELTGLTGRVDADTTNGGIRATDVSGPLQASTTNGGVEADLSRIAEDGIRLECTNGGIRLRLPADARATIAARITNGGINTSGLSLESSGTPSPRQLDARLNGGGPRIRLEGTNGGIQIRAR
jgi:hypothetical protein